jgi:pescadillo protein
MSTGSGKMIGNSESGGAIQENEDENNKTSSKADESELRLAQLQHQLPANEPGALMHLVEETTAVDTDDDETKECKSLFKNLKFYLSREVGYWNLFYCKPIIWRQELICLV